jgi:hypothetical protein
MPAHGEDEVVAGAGKQMGDDRFLIWVLLSKCVWLGRSFEEDEKMLLGGEPGLPSDYSPAQKGLANNPAADALTGQSHQTQSGPCGPAAPLRTGPAGVVTQARRALARVVGAEKRHARGAA